MILRPVDDLGDVLPVLSVSDMMAGKRAGAELTRDWLNLHTGEWWENPALGNAAVEMLKETRFTEADTRALASYLSSYIRETPGVTDVRDVSFSMEGRQFRYACVIETDSGAASVSYQL